MNRYKLLFIVIIIFACKAFSQTKNNAMSTTTTSTSIPTDTIPVNKPDTVDNATGNPLFKNNVNGEQSNAPAMMRAATPVSSDSSAPVKKKRRNKLRSAPQPAVEN